MSLNSIPDEMVIKRNLSFALFLGLLAVGLLWNPVLFAEEVPEKKVEAYSPEVSKIKKYFDGANLQKNTDTLTFALSV